MLLLPVVFWVSVGFHVGLEDSKKDMLLKAVGQALHTKLGQ